MKVDGVDRVDEKLTGKTLCTTAARSTRSTESTYKRIYERR